MQYALRGPGPPSALNDGHHCGRAKTQTPTHVRTNSDSPMRHRPTGAPSNTTADPRRRPAWQACCSPQTWRPWVARGQRARGATRLLVLRRGGGAQAAVNRLAVLLLEAGGFDDSFTNHGDPSQATLQNREFVCLVDSTRAWQSNKHLQPPVPRPALGQLSAGTLASPPVYKFATEVET